MYIEPNTNIRLLTNVPLDKKYENTLYFSDVYKQNQYFLNRTKHTLTSQTYQRVQRGVCRVQKSADVCYDCNYMMFQNASHGSKWFYAFITKVEYISNVVCEIYFEIDVMQTWLFNFTLNECFVEREHSLTDNRGDNILPEPVELGEYIFDGFEKLTNVLEPMAVVIGITDTGDGVAKGTLNGGVYSGVTYYAFNSTDVDTITNFVSTFVTTPDNIVTMFMCPVIVCVEGVIEDGTYTILEYNKSGWGAKIKIPDIGTGLFGNYKPKNNKLYSYPYYFLHINNNNGSSLDLRYEFFDGDEYAELDSCMNPPVKITLRPSNYKGANELHTEVITLDNYPMCSWNTDSYFVWLAQELPKKAFKIGGSVATTAIGALSGNPLALLGGASVVSNVTNTMSEMYSTSVRADILKGDLNNGNVNIAHNMQNFYSARCHITEDYARTIDNFFTMFGYSCKRVKKPNINSRPHWNYVKTTNCTIRGGVPSDDASVICNIFNKGVTFWKNGDEVGNYSLDNSP